MHTNCKFLFLIIIIIFILFELSWETLTLIYQRGLLRLYISREKDAYNLSTLQLSV